MTSDGTDCYTYNDANQLSQVKNCSTNQVISQYVYDYNGNRIEKKIYSNGTLQKTVYSPSDEYETVKLASNSATQNTSYYTVNDQVNAKKNPDGTKNYYLNDNLGSASVLVNQTGTVVEQSTYYPFGQIRSGGTQSKYAYTGQENDPETNLDYYNARYYDPSTMHFTQPDTYTVDIYNPQDLNEYSYVKNNPLTYNDPTGHFAILIAIGISIGIGAAAGAVQEKIAHPNESWFSSQVGAAAGRGAVLGLATGVTGIGIETGVASLIADVAISSGAKAVISGTAGGVASGEVDNTYTNWSEGNQLNANWQSAGVIGGISGGTLSKVSDDLVPANGVGRTPKFWNPTLNPLSLGKNSVKQLKNYSFNEGLNTVFGYSKDQYNLPYYNYNYSYTQNTKYRIKQK